MALGPVFNFLGLFNGALAPHAARCKKVQKIARTVLPVECGGSLKWLPR
jgi:hypothetical protein